MDLTDQPVRKRKAFAKPRQPVIEGPDAVRHFDDVIQRNARSLVQLEEKKVRERRLRSLDLRREHCLLANIAIEEERGLGKQSRNAVETPQRDRRVLERPLERSRELERIRRQRSGNERLDRLSPRARDLGSASNASIHGDLHTRKQY
jgi:hypothetical protein